MLDENITITEKIKDSITFFRTTPVKCPVCEAEIYPEELRQGGRHINVGKLRDDLFRTYDTNEDTGDIFPLLYSVGVCPNPKCLFAALWPDFHKMHKKNIEALATEVAKDKRIQTLRTLFKNIPDFTVKRTLLTGFASYLLALESYDKFRARDTPSIKQAICSLRLAWLSRLLQDYEYGEQYELFAMMFYKKAKFFYAKAIEKDAKGTESLNAVKFLGPDVDKDYGYDGVIYISAWLYFHYGDKRNALNRQENLQKIRTTLSKVFGFGKASKEKPSILLNIARTTFESLEEELNHIDV